MAIPPPPPSFDADDVDADVFRIFDWLRSQYAGGRPALYPPLVICREALGTDGQCDAASWGRLWRALPVLHERGLIEEAPLGQGDLGVRIAMGTTRQG